jgi:hypothetical protein
MNPLRRTAVWIDSGGGGAAPYLFCAPAQLKDIPMKKPPLDPDVDDLAPTDTMLTVYDEQHMITYLRLLDADADGADWREVTRIVLHI